MEGEAHAVAEEIYELGVAASLPKRKSTLRQRNSFPLKVTESKENILEEDEEVEERDADAQAEHKSTYYTAIRMAPLMAVLGMVSGIARPIFLELIKLRVCENYYNYTENVCEHLSNRSHLRESQKVQSMAAQYKIYESIIECVPAIIFSWFIGPWSDEYGRKLPMIIPFFGMTLGYGLAVLFSYIPVRPAVLLITPAVVSISGGELLIHMATFSYMADYTTAQTRSPNIAIADGVSFLMRGAGTALGGYLDTKYGIGTPFALIVGLNICAFVYVLLVIKDSKTHKSFKEARIAEIFDPIRLKQNWHTLVRPRPGHNRMYLWLVFGCVIIAGAVVIGDNSIMQLYLTFAPFYWTLLQYTTYTTVVNIIEAFVMVLATVVLRRFIHLPDSLLAFVAGCSSVGNLILLGVSRSTTMIYVAAAVGLCKMINIVCVRSLLIEFVDHDETGKVMSAMHSIFSIVPMLGVQIFTNIFTHTTDWWSGFCFILGAVLMVPNMCVYLYLFIALRRKRRKEKAANPETTDIKTRV